MNIELSAKEYRLRAENELLCDILPFWIRHARDPKLGGFHGEVSISLVADPSAIKGSLLTARILWTYSAAYRRYPDPAYLDMARYAYDALNDLFWDPEYGGFYWAVTADGKPLQMRKQIYGQAFCVYALAEYYAATHGQAALDRAITLYRLMEAHSYDPDNRGYFEAYTRSWQMENDLRLSDKDMNEAKSQNTHLHIMEAYTNLLRVWPSAELRRSQMDLVDVMLTRIIHPITYHTRLFFDPSWRPRSDHVSYGHDIEASWLLVEAADVLADADLLARVKPLALKMAQAVFDEGLDADGAVLYEASPRGWVDDTKQWWPQAEAAVGFLNAYQLSGKTHFLEAAFRSWDFIETYLIDRDKGEWRRYVTRDLQMGTHDAAKISFWKCPYHNGRACLELTTRLRSIAAGALPT